MDYIIFAILYLSTIVIAWFIYNLVKKIPEMISEKIKSEREFEFNKILQIDNYYRKDGNLAKIMTAWSKYVIDKNTLNNVGSAKGQKEMNDLIQLTVGYGSPRTIRLLSIMSQHIYNNKIPDSPESGLKLWVMLAMVVVSLKKDFANQVIDPLDIIKIRSTDFKEYEDTYSTYVKEITEEIGN
ncbi:hypothetical protein [Lactococcus protaetiae]|uniref:Uncharacterized protein n=1 Tax=Lactococcus protaetiae TaxID=2592653 RepID=A0A514Z6W2_9LACT|nr:hypothetical protein [Lactococcus protaetiae]QDK70338.1 hypothetical protein FLP15_03100 [Lactococcus protaetiae]